MKSILIKDTTKEEREKIVAEALGCGSDCSMCCACGGMKIDYQQYIDGKKEIAQLNAEYRANTMIGHQKSDYVQEKCCIECRKVFEIGKRIFNSYF